MKKGWKLLILISVAVTLMVFLSAASCSIGPITATYSVTVNNNARASQVYLYVNGSYWGTILAFSTSTFSGFSGGTQLQIMNSTGQWMQFSGGAYSYNIWSNVTFFIPSGGTWVTAERE
ncbi:MAG: hypothetical protein GXY29_01605 [Thermotogaceae bacterium]|nr:hypothetical protein [Thermotogota bacterium]NLZ12864.1 hypothetical protein [Thermotogaceae bacterium]MDD8040419.1 hypothetical protein [Thermotogota bacterium]HNR63640.1 hypothetical protein [Thermotogota bacterium]HOZ12436.1 hypothetical protein [Thermotogota bacterium]